MIDPNQPLTPEQLAALSFQNNRNKFQAPTTSVVNTTDSQESSFQQMNALAQNTTNTPLDPNYVDPNQIS
tara:strand:+ start:147 stop:356 length:210 start_codon:yes stop_codon:yes gene_type:complete